MNGLAIFAPVAPACSTASFVLPESSGQRDRACASVSGLDTPELFLFKSLFSEWHRLMTYRRYVIWIPCGICCSSHLDALWQHFLFILQWYPACTQIPAPQSCSGEVWATTASCSLVAVSASWVPKGEQLFRDGECGSGRLCRAGAPWRAAQSCPAGSAAGAQLCTCCPCWVQPAVHGDNLPAPLTATSHRPQCGTNLQPLPLSLLQTCLEIKDVRNRSLHLFSCSSEHFPPQIIHQFTFSGVENTFSYLRSPNVPIYFCTLVYLFPRLFLLISPYLFLYVK